MSLPPVGLPADLRVYRPIQPMNMRNRHDGPRTVNEKHPRLDPLGGALFAFANKTGPPSNSSTGTAPACGC